MPYIRRAEPRDALELTAIAREAKAMWGYAPQVLAAWEGQLSVSAGEITARPVFVTLMDGGIVGFYSLAPASEEWELDNLWVRPSHARRGIGTAMLSHALERARQGGAMGILVDSDPNAEAFYLRAGAVRVGALPAPIPGEPGRIRPQLRLSTHGMRGVSPDRPLRKQYHFRPGDSGLRAWDVDRLVQLTSKVTPQSVPLSSIRELDEPYWGPMTPRDVGEHARLIDECDLNHPIILSSDGRVMDGMHRVLKAVAQGESHIMAVRFDADPEPDYVGVKPEDLPY